MIVNSFLNQIRDYLYGNPVICPTHIGIGIGTTAPTANDTTIESEIYPYGSTRSQISSKTKTTPKKVVMQLSILPSQANGSVLTEVGAFNAELNGVMTNRLIHTPITKEPTYELIYIIGITMSEVI